MYLLPCSPRKTPYLLLEFSPADQSVSAPGLGRGRKPTSTNRSRQQLQRERALKLTAQMSSETLQPEQKLAKPHLTSPSPLAPTIPTAVDTGKDEPVTAKLDAVNNHDPETSIEVTPLANELDKQEVELLVSLLYCS